MAGQEYFGIRIDTDKLEQDAQHAKKAFDDIAEEAVKAGQTVDNAMGKGAKSAAGNFNMLNVSIQQIARELPSLTMSPQMFFMAISNNLPIFTDALASARKEYEAMTASGEKAIPVWKQVAKSLLSWQTAISLLPTLLIVYGDDIVDFFESIFNGSKKIDYASERIKAFKEVISKGDSNAQKDIVQLQLLYNATQDVTRSINERKTAVEQLQSQYPSFFKNISDEEILAGKAAGAYERLTQSIIASARARAAQDKMTENAKVILDNESKITEAYKRREKAQLALQQAEKDYNENWQSVNSEAQRFLAENKRSRQADLDAIGVEIE